MKGIWPRPGRVVALSDQVVKARKMGIVRQRQLRLRLESTAKLHWLRARPA